jgi:predicted amidophosphoribosyltransferase
MVLALKHSRALAVIDIMAAQIAAGVPAQLIHDVTLVPVPAHPQRARVRGFDPAQRLAAAVARRTGVRAHRCLARSPRAERQAGESRAERLAIERLAIAACGAVPPRALLIDDVHTTGATLSAAASALRGAGTEWVGAVTYARTILNMAHRSTDKQGLRD